MDNNGFTCEDCNDKDEEIARLRAALDAAPHMDIYHNEIAIMMQVDPEKYRAWYYGPREQALKGMTMSGLLDPRTDDKIRAALRNADERGKLGVVATVIGIAGGEDELRRMMNSTDELSIMDRGVLGLHLQLRQGDDDDR